MLRPVLTAVLAIAASGVACGGLTPTGDARTSAAILVDAGTAGPKRSSSGLGYTRATKTPTRTRIVVFGQRPGERFRALVRVTAVERVSVPKRRVRLVLRMVGHPGSAEVRHGVLLRGKRSFYLGRLDAGDYRLRAVYLGDRRHQRSARVKRFRVASSPTTATPSPSPSPSPTASPTPTGTPTSSPTPTAGVCVKPDGTNTGTTGTLAAYSGPLDVRTDGTVIENKAITGDLRISADNVTVKNSVVTGHILVVSSIGVRLLNLTVPGVTISASQQVTLDRSNLGFATNQDTLHVTSDGTLRVKDITISNNYIHDPVTSSEDHYDGLQVRGADGIKILCNNFDLGAPLPQYNAAIYLEGGANGGISGAVVDNSWLFGGGYNFYYGRDNDDATRVTNNHFGGDPYWGPNAVCFHSGSVPAVQSGNDLRGEPVTPCR